MFSAKGTETLSDLFEVNSQQNSGKQITFPALNLIMRVYSQSFLFTMNA